MEPSKKASVSPVTKSRKTRTSKGPPKKSPSRKQPLRGEKRSQEMHGEEAGAVSELEAQDGADSSEGDSLAPIEPGEFEGLDAEEIGDTSELPRLQKRKGEDSSSSLARLD